MQESTYIKTNKVIESHHFSGYPTIEELIIPEGVEKIEMYAFCTCKNLKRVIIPRSVKKIQEKAFYGCDSLKEVYFIGTQEEYEKYLSGNEQLAKYLEKAEKGFYSETPLAGAWRFVDDIPVEW